MGRIILPALIDESDWASGISFDAFLAGAGAPGALRMRHAYERVAIPEPLAARCRAFASDGGRFYAVAEPWCPDCTSFVPVLARLAATTNVPLRLFYRDEEPRPRHAHLTGGRGKIPLVAAVRAVPGTPWEEVGRFVERPALANAIRAGAASSDWSGRQLAVSYASGDMAGVALAEFDAMLGGGVERATVLGSLGTRLPAWLHVPHGVSARRAVVAMHGASHDASHPFSLHLCQRLSQRGVAGVRFDFGYRIRGGAAPANTPEEEDLAAVLRWTCDRLGLSPRQVVLAGKSLGARIAVRAASRHGLAGIVAFGLPLHVPDGSARISAGDLAAVQAPMLWFSGDRDQLADLGQVRALAAEVRGPLTLEILPGADHSLAGDLHAVLDRAIAWILSLGA